MARVTAENSERAIALIYSALLGETHWQEVVDEVAMATNAEVATLFYHDAHSGSGAITLAHGIPEAVQRDYIDHFAPLNPWMSQVAATKLGEGIVGEQIVPRDHFLRTEYYNDFLRHQGQEAGIGVTISRDGGCFFLCSVLCGDTDFERNSARAGHLTQLAPHLRRVSDFYRKQRADTFGGGFAGEIGEVGGIATVVVNAAARVIYASPLGEARLAGGSPLRIGASGAVSFRSPEVQDAFRLALRRSLMGTRTTKLVDGDTEITFVRSARDYGSRIFLGGTVAILMARRERKAVPDTARIASAYRLTPAEKRVLEAILAGQRPSEIAASAGISTETVRSQLKAIFSKTNTNGQTALVRLATGLGDMDS